MRASAVTRWHQVLEVVCDEHGFGGSGEYCGNNDAHLDRINVFYHEASGGKYVPHAVLFDLEPGVTGAVSLSRFSATTLQPGKPCELYARVKLGQRPQQNFSDFPLSCSGFCSELRARAGARP